MFDFGEVKKINAETILERPPQLRLLRRVVKEQSDFRNFRLVDATKAAHYSCEWGAREDGMLLVGIDRYGFGAWTQIRDDRELGMQDKFFLEEHRIEKKQEREHTEVKAAKAPGAVHLVRRSEYLLSVLTAVHSGDVNAQKVVENHHRNNKKSAHAMANGYRRSDKTSASASPAPQSIKKIAHHRERDSDRAHARGEHHHRSRSNVAEGGTPRPDSKRKHSGEMDERNRKHRRLEEQKRSDDDMRDPETDDDDDKRNAPIIAALMQPIWSHVEKVESCTKVNIPIAKARAKVLKNEITAIGNFIEGLHKSSGLSDQQLADLKPKLWRFVSKRIPASDKDKQPGKSDKDKPAGADPNRMTGPRLAGLYQQLKQAEKQGDGPKVKNGETPVANGSSRGESSKPKH
ncbi:chromodomain helicase [Apiospora aurea]|uniref:Chromodomain helicase n=1 Tax=Apiospora aurea TaxID=335848 RepID=A0ABR1QDL3_9PEZI